MATVEQTPTVSVNGSGADGIPVENPATGEIIRTVPNTSPDVSTNILEPTS